MSDPFETMDPNLKEVLLDIAKDERSTLFRVEPREIAVGVMDDVPSLSAGTAGWTPAERHLLQAYREEVALLLQDAFRARLEENETGRAMFEFKDLNQRRVRTGGSYLSKSATRLLERGHYHCISSGYRTVLGELGASPRSVSSSLGDLARLAYQLVSSEIGLILIGISHLFQGELDRATMVFQEHLQNSARADLRRHSWANLGKTLSQQGESRKAYDAHLEARQGGPWTPIHAWNCFATALDCGDSALIYEALEQIGTHTSVDDVARAKVCALTVEMRRSGWSPNDGVMIVEGLQTRLSAEGRYLADVLLK